MGYNLDKLKRPWPSAFGEGSSDHPSMAEADHRLLEFLMMAASTMLPISETLPLYRHTPPVIVGYLPFVPQSTSYEIAASGKYRYLHNVEKSQ